MRERITPDRPGRRAQDAVAEIVHYINNGYAWVVEGDIAGCFDNIRHDVVVERIRRRITDRRVVNLCKEFLKAGVLTELGQVERRLTGTPQGHLKVPYRRGDLGHRCTVQHLHHCPEPVFNRPVLIGGRSRIGYLTHAWATNAARQGCAWTVKNLPRPSSKSSINRVKEGLGLHSHRIRFCTVPLSQIRVQRPWSQGPKSLEPFA
ncbi:reverse transcriptase domain-containing protein [Streptomyces olivoreticuli]